MSQASIELVSPADLDRARVALVVADAVDESAAKVVGAIQRDGIPRVVLVASRFEEGGVVAAVAAGVTSFLRRAEATTARLVQVLNDADREGCQLPEGLMRMAAASAAAMRTPAPSYPTRETAGRDGDTLTGLRLSTRESEVLRLVADGYDTADIAGRLSFSESTIKGILGKVMTRVGARNRCHAVAIAAREGLI